MKKLLLKKFIFFISILQGKGAFILFEIFEESAVVFKGQIIMPYFFIFTISALFLFTVADWSSPHHENTKKK